MVLPIIRVLDLLGSRSDWSHLLPTYRAELSALEVCTDLNYAIHRLQPGEEISLWMSGRSPGVYCCKARQSQ